MQAYPRSALRFEVIHHKGRVLHRMGRCTAAVAVYAEALEKVSAAQMVDDTMWFMAVCYSELGRHDRARDGLSKYLERFPDGRHAADARVGLRSLVP